MAAVGAGIVGSLDDLLQVIMSRSLRRAVLFFLHVSPIKRLETVLLLWLPWRLQRLRVPLAETLRQLLVLVPLERRAWRPLRPKAVLRLVPCPLCLRPRLPI